MQELLLQEIMGPVQQLVLLSAEAELEEYKDNSHKTVFLEVIQVAVVVVVVIRQALILHWEAPELVDR